jgi:hypothetical protein
MHGMTRNGKKEHGMTRNDKELEGFKWDNKERQEMTGNGWKMTRNGAGVIPRNHLPRVKIPRRCVPRPVNS